MSYPTFADIAKHFITLKTNEEGAHLAAALYNLATPKTENIRFDYNQQLNIDNINIFADDIAKAKKANDETAKEFLANIKSAAIIFLQPENREFELKVALNKIQELAKNDEKFHKDVLYKFYNIFCSKFLYNGGKPMPEKYIPIFETVLVQSAEHKFAELSVMNSYRYYLQRQIREKKLNPSQEVIIKNKIIDLNHEIFNRAMKIFAEESSKQNPDIKKMKDASVQAHLSFENLVNYFPYAKYNDEIKNNINLFLNIHNKSNNHNKSISNLILAKAIADGQILSQQETINNFKQKNENLKEMIQELELKNQNLETKSQNLETENQKLQEQLNFANTSLQTKEEFIEAVKRANEKLQGGIFSSGVKNMKQILAEQNIKEK